MPEFKLATSVLWYLSVRAEVATHEPLQQALAGQQQVVVPFCDGTLLKLFWLKAWSDLQPGAFGILEPKPELQADRQREVPLQAIDFAIVPGVAFDRAGHRLGHGQGYYDRLLATRKSTTLLCGVCFESQLVEAIPLQPHDVVMDRVITEKACYRACDQ